MQSAQDSGSLNLMIGNRRPASLVLVADMAHRQRPSGTDPLDIRDYVDWLEPTLTLSRPQLLESVARFRANDSPGGS